MARGQQNEITVVDLDRVEQGAHDFAQISMNLQQQVLMACRTLKQLKTKGHGRWVRQLERDVQMLTTYLDTASELAAEVCADLDTLLEQFQHKPDESFDDFDGYDEYPEEFE